MPSSLKPIKIEKCLWITFNCTKLTWSPVNKLSCEFLNASLLRKMTLEGVLFCCTHCFGPGYVPNVSRVAVCETFMKFRKDSASTTTRIQVILCNWATWNPNVGHAFYKRLIFLWLKDRQYFYIACVVSVTSPNISMICSSIYRMLFNQSQWF